MSDGKYVGTEALSEIATQVNSKVATAVPLTQKGQANGVATLDASGRIPFSQLPESAMEFKGSWDASTNTPTLKDGVGTNGDFYLCSAAGTVNFGTTASPRNITFYVNDRVICTGTGTSAVWSRIPASEVRSVNGLAGDVTLTASNVNYATGTTIKAAIDGKVPTTRTVNGHALSANVTVTKSDIGLSAVVNTGDSATPVENGTTKFTTGGAYTELAKKVDKVDGKGLSANDFTDTLKTKLDGIADGAQVNQDAFSKVKVGDTVVAADAQTDTLELVAGSNVTLTPDETNDKITIAATDTTYESKAAASGGTDVSLVTTGEKYIWNNKQDAITGGASTITSGNLTASRALISNANGKVAVSSTTSTELGYVHGVTSAIQTQLNGKVPNTRTVNGKALSADVSLAASDISGVATPADITTAIEALDVTSVGGAGKYISAISETDGKISATATTMDTTPTADSTNAVTSGGVQSAIATAETNAKNLANATGTLAVGKGGTGQTTAVAAETSFSAAVYLNSSTVPATATKVVTASAPINTIGARFVLHCATTNTADNPILKVTVGSDYYQYTLRYHGSAISKGYLSATRYLEFMVLTAATKNGANGVAELIGDLDTNTTYTAMVDARCDTTGGTAAKVASGTSVTTLMPGSLVLTRIVNSNTSGTALTFNCGSTGAKPLYINGAPSSTTNYTLNAGTYLFYYDGTNWYVRTDGAFVATVTASEVSNVAKALSGMVTVETAADTAAKTATLAGFTLHNGARLVINLVNTNTVANATLNINDTGAKTVHVNGNAVLATGNWNAGVYNAFYDGIDWYLWNASSYDSWYAATADSATEAGYTRGNAYCTTTADKPSKVALMQGFNLTDGATFPITFTNQNTVASAITLNVNYQGAKTIYLNGKVTSSTNYSLPRGTFICTYRVVNGAGRFYIDTEYSVPTARSANEAYRAVLADGAVTANVAGKLQDYGGNDQPLQWYYDEMDADIHPDKILVCGLEDGDDIYEAMPYTPEQFAKFVRVPQSQPSGTLEDGMVWIG